MKMYYKLIVTATIPHDVKVSFVHAFNLMEIKTGYKWITFYGMTDDIITAYDLLIEQGYITRKIWYKGGKI